MVNIISKGVFFGTKFEIDNELYLGDCLATTMANYLLSISGLGPLNGKIQPSDSEDIIYAKLTEKPESLVKIGRIQRVINALFQDPSYDPLYHVWEITETPSLIERVLKEQWLPKDKKDYPLNVTLELLSHVNVEGQEQHEDKVMKVARIMPNVFPIIAVTYIPEFEVLHLFLWEKDRTTSEESITDIDGRGLVPIICHNPTGYPSLHYKSENTAEGYRVVGRYRIRGLGNTNIG